MKLGSIRQGGNKDIIQGDWNGRECRPMSISFGSRTILCLLSLLLWSTIILPNGVCAQKLTAIVDNNHVAFGESFRLTVETSIHLTDDLDFSPLEKDFEILSTSKGSRVNYINGNLETSISWTLELSPKKTGTLTIPSLQGKDGSSDPITITVDKSTGGQSEISKEIFVEMDCDPKDPYVGQQVLCRLRLFYGPNLREGGLTNPEVRDAVVRQLGKDQTYQESRNGRSYSVSERRFALFFQTSGVEDIGVPVFTGRVLDARYGRRNSFGSFFEPFGGGGVTKRVRIEGKAQTINVQPRPAEMNDLNWLPAQELELHDQWSSDNTHMKKGDLISRTVIIDAKGLAGSQLPDPAPQEVAGFKVYADKAVESTTDDFNGVSGQRKQEIAFIADEVGVFSLPAITLKWWDTQHKVMREASLPARAM
ncbi:MAG: BatD family protein, partial [Desulfobulbaceae bacterium]|nr:BatD family protein [Desulfobulbaceae bacterium]